MRPVRARVLSLVLLAALTFCLGLGRQALSDGDEGGEEEHEEMEDGGTSSFKFVDLVINIDFFRKFQSLVEFYFQESTINFSAASVMEHLCRIGLPAEFIEEQFIYN